MCVLRHSLHVQDQHRPLPFLRGHVRPKRIPDLSSILCIDWCVYSVCMYVLRHPPNVLDHLRPGPLLQVQVHPKRITEQLRDH